jgi:hypothetical protein
MKQEKTSFELIGILYMIVLVGLLSATILVTQNKANKLEQMVAECQLK